MEEIVEKMQILRNPHHFLTMCTWDAPKEYAHRMKPLLSNYVFLLEQQRNYQDGRNFTHKTAAWSYDMFKKVKQLCKVSHPCLDDHQFKKEELESVGESSAVDHKLS